MDDDDKESLLERVLASLLDAADEDETNPEYIRLSKRAKNMSYAQLAAAYPDQVEA